MRPSVGNFSPKPASLAAIHRASKCIFFLGSFAALSFAPLGCATYQIAEQMKMIALSDHFQDGKSVGAVSGQDCKWTILGVQPEGPVNLLTALRDAKPIDAPESGELRYITEVKSQRNDLDVGFFAKNCLTVTGTGFQ